MARRNYRLGGMPSKQCFACYSIFWPPLQCATQKLLLLLLPLLLLPGP
jgi:hypothetical protein